MISNNEVYMQGLEFLFQEFRIRKIWADIIWHGVLVDFGCDREITLLKRVHRRMSQAIGLDIISQPQRLDNISILPADLEKKLPLAAHSADTVTMLAVLEHLSHPETAVKEAYRILKPGGVFLVTVPSPASQKILPLLAKFQIVRQEMIDQHHNYFTHQQLESLARSAGFRQIQIESWELGFNTFMKAVK